MINSIVSNQEVSRNLHPVPSNDPDEPLVSVPSTQLHVPQANAFVELVNRSEMHQLQHCPVLLTHGVYHVIIPVYARFSWCREADYLRRLDIGTVIWGNLNTELGISYENLNNSFAANCAGLAVGCIFLIPYALKYGRRPIYLLSCCSMLASAIWQAKMQTTVDLILTNVFSGFGGAVSEAIVQMTISDLFFVHQRATMNGLYILMVTTGTFLAPVVAGVSAVNQGWRWIWWWTAILLGISLVLFAFAYEESKYTPILTAASTDPPADVENRIGKGDTSKKDTKLTEEPVDMVEPPDDAQWPLQRKSLRQRFALITRTPGDPMSIRQMISRFALILFRFPAAIYVAVVYASLLAWFSVILTTMSTYFTLPPYNFDAMQIGLLNLPPFIGSTVGLVFSGPMNDWLILRLAQRNNGVFEPEMRLWIALPGILLTPLSIFLYGFSLVDVRFAPTSSFSFTDFFFLKKKGRHWIIPCIGTAVFGVAFSLMGTTALTYLTDCYREVSCPKFLVLLLANPWCSSSEMLLWALHSCATP